MGQASILGELEQMVLMAVLRLDDPYPVSVRNEIHARAGVACAPLWATVARRFANSSS